MRRCRLEYSPPGLSGCHLDNAMTYALSVFCRFWLAVGMFAYLAHHLLI